MSKRIVVLDPKSIKFHRERQGITQKELARRLDPERVQKRKTVMDRISEWERTGRVWMPYAEPLAKALEVGLADLELIADGAYAEWWVHQEPWVNEPHAAFGSVLPTVWTMGAYVSEALERWRLTQEEDLRLELQDGIFRITVDKDERNRLVEIRRVRLDPQRGLLWMTAGVRERMQADQELQKILFDHAFTVVIHGARFPETLEGMVTVVEVTEGGRRSVRHFDWDFAFNAACRQWLREKSEDGEAYTYEFSLDRQHHGIRIERSTAYRARFSDALIYLARPDAHGAMIPCPWLLSQRKGLLSLLPSWREALIIWPYDENSDEPVPLFGFEPPAGAPE